MTDTSATPEAAGAPAAPVLRLARMPSGIPGLDDILRGGFVRNGIYVVRGTPGAGKTIFGNQMCFAHVKSGGRALYVTLLSEQHERMLANIGQLAFFDPSCIARELTYVSAFQILERDGLPGLVTLIRREIVSQEASLLVIDGVLAAEAHAGSDLEFKKFVHDLQMLAGAGDCTMFLLTSARDASISPEHTMVDGLIELSDTIYGWRSERELRVRKSRGSSALAGVHAMHITSDGIVVHPRLEALLDAPARRPYPAEPARVSTNISGLDPILNGGLPEGSSTLVLGPPGAGKTTAAIQFLADCTAEAPGLMLGFYETPEQILARASTLAPGLQGLADAGIVEFTWHAATESLIDEVAGELLARIARRNVKRLVIDGLLGFMDMTVQPARIPRFYRALSHELRARGVTALCTLEVPELIGPVINPPLAGLTPVAENLLLLRYVEHQGTLKRLMSVMKLRASPFDPRLREFEITSQGLTIRDGFRGAEAVLSGFAHAEPAADPGAN